MKQKDSRCLPPCPFSAYCLRLIDDLDSTTILQQFEEVSFAYDIQDELLLDQLRLHVPDCPTCTALLTYARRVRYQQRAALYSLLLENESKVPSTTPQIFAAIHREQNGAAPNTKRMHYYLQELVISPGAQKLNGNGNHDHAVEPHTSGRSQRMLRNAFSLATIAALVLAAMGLFSHMFVSDHSTTPVQSSSNSSSSNGQSVLDQVDWDSIMISVTVLSASRGMGQLTSIYNYDPATGYRKQLGPSFATDSVQLDGIPHDGQNLLYHYVSGGYVRYQTLRSLSKTGFFYRLNATDWNAGNAVWMDSNSVFVADGGNGVVEVDTRTGRTMQRFPNPRTVQLAFYHSHYLYYISGLPIWQGVWPALYRINTDTPHDQPHRISMRSPGSTFWFSPDGSTIFYLNKGPDGQKGIYAVSNDGTNSRLLRPGDATPIGYAENNAVMFMQEVNDKFQVVQLGATPQQKETVVMPDAAPGAISLCDHQVMAGTSPICDNDIALAPYGHKLILNAYYPGGKHKVLYDDLTTKKSSVLMSNLDNNSQVQLPGWDKMAVPGIGSSPTPVPTTVQPSISEPTATAAAYSPMIPVLQDRYYARQNAY